jgi:hypothetical protein
MPTSTSLYATHSADPWWWSTVQKWLETEPRRCITKNSFLKNLMTSSRGLQMVVTPPFFLSGRRNLFFLSFFVFDAVNDICMHTSFSPSQASFERPHSKTRRKPNIALYIIHSVFTNSVQYLARTFLYLHMYTHQSIQAYIHTYIVSEFQIKLPSLYNYIYIYVHV